MRKSSMVLVFVFLSVFATAVRAITYGQPDGNLHPNVGALIFTTEDGLSFPYCSGTLIASDVFLTAAHCDISDITGTNQVQVSFETDIAANQPPSLIAGTFIANPLFSQRQNDSHDIAIVRLAAPQNLPLAQLPTAGQFDNLQQTNRDQQFTVVGYGGEEPVPTPGLGIVIGFLDIRQFSTATLNAVNSGWLRLSQNPATGDGGACFGDSGGPNFLGAGAEPTSVIAGITITGDAVCRATNVIYRLDTAAAREFLVSQGVVVP
jgi:secreted trypsin-like serine protease